MSFWHLFKASKVILIVQYIFKLIFDSLLPHRELGLDELLRHCEILVEKLHCPEKDPCYLAMAGTTIFTHTTFDMLQNHSRYNRVL